LSELLQIQKALLLRTRRHSPALPRDSNASN